MKSELQKVFKKFKGVYFYLDPKELSFGWIPDSSLKPVPCNRIYIGFKGSAPFLKLSPLEIKEMRYDKKKLFKNGTLYIVGNDDKVLFKAEFKDKENYKSVENFNLFLDLYKKNIHE